MTARNQPHKYRCETCAFRKDQEGKVHLAECQPHGPKTTYNLYNIDFRRTATLGCASHSDATKAEQRIADVIKELGELTNALENMEPERGSENWCAMQAYKRCIALLREKEE